MTSHKLSVEGRWGYCLCGWSTGPAGIGQDFDAVQREIDEDFRAHLRQRYGEDEREMSGRPVDPAWSFDDELDDWDNEVEEVLTW